MQQVAMACSCSSASLTSFAGASPSTCASSSSSSSSVPFLYYQRQLPGSKQALLRLDCEKYATQSYYFVAAAKQGQEQYDKAKKANLNGGGRSTGVAVKEQKASWKGGGTGSKNPKSFNKNPSPKSYENSNSRLYSSNRSASRLPFIEDIDEDEAQDDNDAYGSHRNPGSSNNTSNKSRNSRSYNTSTSSRGGQSLRMVSDEVEDDEDDEEDGRHRSSRLSSNSSNSSRNSKLSNTTISNVKGGSRLRTLSDEEEDNSDGEDEEQGDFASDDEDGYAELPIMPIPPAGFVLAEDGSVSIMAPPQKRVTTLVDQETKLSLDCLIRRVFSSSDGRQCFLLCPLDTPVQILRVDNGEVLKEISDEELEDVFPTASYELAKRRLHLVQSGYCLTLRGGFCFSDDEVIDLDTVYGESGEGDRPLNEGVEVASFMWNESEYLIFTPLDPLMFVAHKDNKTGELLIADDDLLEDEAVLDAIDEEKEFQAYMEEENLIVEDDEEEE